MSIDSFEFLPLLGLGIIVLLIQQSSSASLGCVSVTGRLCESCMGERKTYCPQVFFTVYSWFKIFLNVFFIVVYTDGWTEQTSLLLR